MTDIPRATLDVIQNAAIATERQANRLEFGFKAYRVKRVETGLEDIAARLDEHAKGNTAIASARDALRAVKEQLPQTQGFANQHLQQPVIQQLKNAQGQLQKIYWDATGQPVNPKWSRWIHLTSPNSRPPREPLPPGAPQPVPTQPGQQATPFPVSEQAVAHAGYEPPTVPPILLQHGTDLTRKAQKGELGRIIGREDQIEQVIQTLSRRGKSSAVLVGDAGVGKTAIAEGLAQRIIAGEVPERLQNTIVVSLDMGKLDSNTKYRGEFETKMTQILDAAKQTDGRVIVFADEMHKLMRAGSHSEASNVGGNMLKEPLARGEVKMIGATTLDEYREVIEGDSAMTRRFRPVYVDELNTDDTREVLNKLTGPIEDYYGVGVSDDVQAAAARWADRYLPDQKKPDSAIDLVDEAASAKRMANERESQELTRLRSDIGKLVEREQKLSQRTGDASAQELAKVTAQIEELTAKLPAAKERWRAEIAARPEPQVTKRDIAEIIHARKNIPVSHMLESENDSARFLEMDTELQRKVIGQKAAITAVSEAMIRANGGMSDPAKPLATLLFPGPTGVGKTEMAKAVAEFVFGDRSAVTTVNGGTDSISTIIGSARGIQDSQKGGKLTEAVRQRPYQVVLIDEIDKMAPETRNMMLELLDEGRLTDGSGRPVDFSNTVVIGTTNAGAKSIVKGTSPEDKAKGALGELESRFPPEFLNRFQIVPFDTLSPDEIRQVTDLAINNVTRQVSTDRNIGLEVSDGSKDYLAKIGYHPEFGARPLSRVLESEIKTPIARANLEGKVPEGATVAVDKDGDKLLFKVGNDVIAERPILESHPATLRPDESQRQNSDLQNQLSNMLNQNR